MHTFENQISRYKQSNSTLVAQKHVKNLTFYLLSLKFSPSLRLSHSNVPFFFRNKGKEFQSLLKFFRLIHWPHCWVFFSLYEPLRETRQAYGHVSVITYSEFEFLEIIQVVKNIKNVFTNWKKNRLFAFKKL